MTRSFIFKDTVLPDPNTKMGINQVLAFYSAQYPEIINATAKIEVDAPNNTTKYILEASMGKKG